MPVGQLHMQKELERLRPDAIRMQRVRILRRPDQFRMRKESVHLRWALRATQKDKEQLQNLIMTMLKVSGHLPVQFHTQKVSVQVHLIFPILKDQEQGQLAKIHMLKVFVQRHLETIHILKVSVQMR